MKRTVGAMMLLAGLSGCISFQPPKNDQASKNGSATARAPVAPLVQPNLAAMPLPTTGSNPANPYPPGMGSPYGGAPLTNSLTSLPPNGSPPNWTPPTQPAGWPGQGGVQQYTAARPVGGTSPADVPPGPAGTFASAATPPRPLPDSIIPFVTTPKSALASATSNDPERLPRTARPEPAQGGPEIQTTAAAAKPDEKLASSPVRVNDGPKVAATDKIVEVNPPPPTPTATGTAAGSGDPIRSPMFRFVNSRQISLNFEVNDVGPSGVSEVELWCTQGGGKWDRHVGPPKAHGYLIEVDREGTYGFTLVARSGNGLAKKPPAAGDSPQVWVIVDTTAPTVEVEEPKASRSSLGQTVVIHWKASDRHLAGNPISLSYAETPEGPWKAIATNQQNSGEYVWPLPEKLGQFVVRVEAVDLAGNVGQATSRPLLLDGNTPNITIKDVTAAK